MQNELRLCLQSGPMDNDRVYESTSQRKKVIIVGAGVSGLACATELLRGGESDFQILEASEKPGGRVCTDEVDGFLLDRGFQVYIEEYPEVCSYSCHLPYLIPIFLIPHTTWDRPKNYLKDVI